MPSLHLVRLRPLSVEFHESFMAFNFADVTGYLWGKRKKSFMGCERSFIPMKLIWLGYLVFALGNCVMKLCINLFQVSRTFVVKCSKLYLYLLSPPISSQLVSSADRCLYEFLNICTNLLLAGLQPYESTRKGLLLSIITTMVVSWLTGQELWNWMMSTYYELWLSTQ